MNNKMLAIGVVLATALVAGVFTTTPLAFADESSTTTEQGLAQSNVGSGESTNFNCGRNTIDGETELDIQACGTIDVGEEEEVGPVTPGGG